MRDLGTVPVIEPATTCADVESKLERAANGIARGMVNVG
jgi:hypothetical protein